MVKVIKNKIKNKSKRRESHSGITSFIPNAENAVYLQRIYNTKKFFINKAISFYILLLNNPKKIMIELKRMHPEVWKNVNRRKF